MTTPGSLRAVEIGRSFAGVRALSNVSLEVHRHEVVGLMGANGAGKSTLVNLLSGFDVPTEGVVLFNDEDITTWPAHRRARAGLARTFQHGHAFPSLSVRENIEVAALGCGAGAREARRRATALLDRLGIADLASRPAGAVAHGDERLLGVARALATAPTFVMMDEPAAGLNEDEIGAFASMIRRLRDEHEIGVLLIDHNVPLLLGVCDRIHVLDEGLTLAEGTAEEIHRHPEVIQAYLGVSAA